MSTSKDLVPIKFHNDTIYLIEKENQPFTPIRFIEELARIYALETEGVSRAEIARRLGRSSSMISFTLRFRPKTVEVRHV